MRRFVTLVVLLLFAIPFGVSISGCSKKTAPTYCNGGDSGIATGQATNILITPLVYGISLNYAEIGQISPPATTDCKGSTVFVQGYTYGTTNMQIADVQPATGRICAGTWNRNSGGGIPDYTYCTPTNITGTAYVSASANGVTSNPLPVFVHPVVTSIVLGPSPGSTATITGWSIKSNVPTFTAQNSFTAGQVVSLSSFPTSTFFNGITNAVVQAAGLSSSQFTVNIPGFAEGNRSATETGLALDCTTDPTTNCCPLATVNAVTANTYLGNSCVSQGVQTQLAARVYAGTGTRFTGLTTAGSSQVTAVPSVAGLAVGQTVTSTAFPSGTTITGISGASPYTVTVSANATATNTTPILFNQTNLSCQAGHLQYTVQGATSQTEVSPVVSIDQNGVATAAQPGSVLITANLANAASSAGIFSTCPPASIALSAAGVAAGPVTVNENNQQSLVATAVDTNGVTLNGLTFEFESTSPSTIGASATLKPTYAGTAEITAVCQPPSCNPAAYNQIGLFGNGKPATSNSLTVTTPGTNSTVLYMASTESTSVVQVDFTTGAVGTPFVLPFVPNSMVISNDGLSLYLGSSTGLMVLSAINSLSLSRSDITSPGTVLAVSPDGSALVISDPVHQVIEIENTSGGVVTEYGGLATHAEFSPDSQTVYIAAGNQLLVFSENSGWTSYSNGTSTPATPAGTPVTDVAVTVPHVGAYFAGPTTTARGYCSASTPAGTAGNETNVFFPLADDSAAVTDRIAATNDGMHIVGATVSGGATLQDLKVSIPLGNAIGTAASIACPLSGAGLTFASTYTSTKLAPVTATAITGVLPTVDSMLAFVTYTGSGGVVPAYAPQTGTISYVPLSGAATAPIAGVLSADSSVLYVGTSGDNLVHIVTRNGSTATDTSTVAPNLVAAPNQSVPAGTQVPVNLIVQKPRKTT
jgi:hypothetical protein